MSHTMNRSSLVRIVALAALLVASPVRAEESNRNDVRANVERGGWSVVWGKNFTEADWARGTAAIAESISEENPGPFLNWFDRTLDENLNKLERNMRDISRRDLERWVVQSLRERRIIRYKNIEVSAGFATYDRWQRIVYDEPRTRMEMRREPITGIKTEVPVAYTERVEKRLNLPNWHQFYVRYRLVPGGNPTVVVGPANGAQRMIHYTMSNDTRYPLILEFSPSGTRSELAPGRSISCRSPVERDRFPKVKAVASNGHWWERTIRDEGGEYRIVDRGNSQIQLVP